MSTFKRTKVVMLPAKEGVTGDFITSNGRLFWHPHKAAIAKVVDDYKFESQHLYFLSDDEIKEGDWFMWMDNKAVCKAEGMLNIINTHQKAGDVKKIIATTDGKVKTMLTHGHDVVCIPLPEPSQGFVQKYCEKGGIDEVMVEYEFRHDDSVPFPKTLDGCSVPKVSSDNTITIRAVKDSWDREEIEEIIRYLDIRIAFYSGGEDMKSTVESMCDEVVVKELRKFKESIISKL